MTLILSAYNEDIFKGKKEVSIYFTIESSEPSVELISLFKVLAKILNLKNLMTKKIKNGRFNFNNKKSLD